jgi:hypothetical protein
MWFSNQTSKVIFLVMLLIGVVFVATETPAQKPDASGQKDPLIGRWKSDEAVIEFRSAGRITINDEEYAYKVKNSVITVTGEDGSLAFPFLLDGDTLVVDVEGREVIYKRIKTDGAGGLTTGVVREDPAERIIPEFVGKWCYLSSLTGKNAYISSRCFVLYANGTYEYSAESSSSGAYGSTAGQSHDTGRWSATRTTLTAYSSKNGKIQLRNHPKNNDPMIVVDGDAYVTATQKRPW